MRDMAAALAKAKADAESSRAAAAELAMTVEVPTFVLSLAPLRASSLAFPSRLYVPLLVPVSRTRPPAPPLLPLPRERGKRRWKLCTDDIYARYLLVVPTLVLVVRSERRCCRLPRAPSCQVVRGSDRGTRRTWRRTRAAWTAGQALESGSAYLYFTNVTGT